MTQESSAISGTNNPKFWLIKRLQMMMGLLSAQFLIGMALNTIGEPEDSTPTITALIWHWLLALHIALGIGLLISAGFILVYSARNFSQVKGPVTISLIGITFAIVFGTLTAAHFHEELASFLMAASFLIAISVYGRTLAKLGPN